MKSFKSWKYYHKWLSENDHHNHESSRFVRFLFPLTGLACLIWLIVRIIPKPSRAQYPCMKVAAPVAGSFVAYVVGLVVAALSFKKAGDYFRNSKYLLASVLVFSGFAAGLFMTLNTGSESFASSVSTDSLFVPVDPPNSPM